MSLLDNIIQSGITKEELERLVIDFIRDNIDDISIDLPDTFENNLFIELVEYLNKNFPKDSVVNANFWVSSLKDNEKKSN